MALVSDCCDAAPWLGNADLGLCGDCKEHCEFIDDESPEYEKLQGMADITMCKGTGCKVKESCYRYTAPVNEHRQSYFLGVPLYYDHETGIESCDHYWERQLFN